MLKQDGHPSKRALGSLPRWSHCLVSVGERISDLTNQERDRRATVALCLPCVDFAAAFLGLGIIKSHFGDAPIQSSREQLNSLIGQGVIYNKGKKTCVGTLAFSPNCGRFKVELKKNLCEMLDENDWPYIRPTGKVYGGKRRLHKDQVERIAGQTHSITTLRRLLRCRLGHAAPSSSGLIFSVYGNKARLFQELRGSLFPNGDVTPASILRPKGHPDYDEYFHCDIHANRQPIIDENEAILILEASRNLADQLAASRSRNRIVLLGRNSVDYQDSAHVVQQASSVGRSEVPSIDVKLLPSIKLMKFYHQ